MGQRASEDLRLFNFMVFHGPVGDEAGPVSLKVSPANFLVKPNFRISPMFDPSTALNSVNAQQNFQFHVRYFTYLEYLLRCISFSTIISRGF